MASIHKNSVTPVVIANGQTKTLDAFDVTNHNSVSCQAKTEGVGVTGTAKLVQSNDGEVWFDFPAAQYPNASKALIADGSVMLEAPYASAAFVALQVEVTAGNASTTYKMLAKEY